MAIRLYNTLSRQKEDLKTLNEGRVGMYICGPTVYDYPHIGNYRAYVAGDVLKRYLRYRGYKVRHVMNVTDVDDKTIRGSQKEKTDLATYTKKYEDAFFEDLDSLNILPADEFPRATDHIKEMVDIIKSLLEKRIAYKAEDGSVYFDVGKFPDYGKLASIDPKSLKTGGSGRVSADEYTKENVQDFALWKSYEEEDGDVFWETEIGKGRPGWHIECSAMSMKHLGATFDIHGGGIDLVFPHHQNEIAQSEGSTGKKFVNHWVHNEWLLVEGEKMSKSLGNFYTLRDVLEKGHASRAIRYLLLSTHYRQQLNFTFKGLEAAANSVERLQEVVRKLKDAKEGKHDEAASELIAKAREGFNQAMDDDLSISEGLAVIFEFVRDINKSMEIGISKENAEEALELLRDFDEVLGVMDFSEESLEPEILELVEKRDRLRMEKKFDEADSIRDELKEKGVIVDDTGSGARWKKIK